MREVDFLFIHPATHCRSSDPIGRDLVTFLVMPLGTIALADLLNRNGYSAVVYHTGIEQIQERGFRVEDIFKIYEPRVVGIDLHWFVHSYDAVRIAGIAKQNSNARVVLGGFTASYFAEEILNRFECIDMVIRGDAERPLLELMRHLEDEEFNEVPNLVYRENGIIKRSENKFVAGVDDLRELDYTSLGILHNHERYCRLISQSGDLDPYPWRVSVKRHTWLPLGRGCSVDCSYCGGGRKAHQLITGRAEPIFHPKQQVLETLSKFEELGFDSVYMDFDPYPDRRYYHELFEMIRREDIDISAQFLLWSLSDKSFIRDFRRTFNPLYSTLTVSPESGSEEVRMKNKGFYYTNDELTRWLEDAKEEAIPIEVYFSTGLSWETPETFEDTIRLGEKMIERYPIASIACNPLVLEPASPRYIAPEDFGLRIKFRSFLDYYERFRRLAIGLPAESRLGYDTEWQNEHQIIENSFRFNQMIYSTSCRESI
ncbi:radical SAM protein [Candidatus Bathyarchaeota archaeon]|nr:radical SAM protein [Candidatus Bathyarchaeota archaeon]